MISHPKAVMLTPVLLSTLDQSEALKPGHGESQELMSLALGLGSVFMQHRVDMKKVKTMMVIYCGGLANQKP